MAIPKEHLIAIVPTDNIVYPLRVVCSCQWQAEAVNRGIAQWFVGQHRGAQIALGNSVLVAEEKTDG